ncbi:MAG: hypothetical protein JST48_06520 [Bacteroidetes bacterium]|nr:hypothetical protein [Bacteroidota bacterium]
MIRISLRVIFCLSLLLINSCSYVWVPDPIDPRLPKYTEKGYNTAGALINGKLWKSTVEYFLIGGAIDVPQVLFFPNQDSLVVNFYGKMDSLSNSTVTVSFLLKNTQVNGWEDMIQLKGEKFTIDGTANKAWVIPGYSFYTVPCPSSATGQLYIKYFKVDSTAGNHGIIMSGTFSLTQNDATCGSYQVTYGRFDYVF